jgi:Putative transposase of IS4/5 family (DUF4096)
MWTTENRHRYDRDKLRCPSDLTDAEWQQIEPMIPPAKRGGGKRTVNMREVVNGMMYVLSTGALHSQRSATEEHGGWLFLPAGLGRHIAGDSSRALRQTPRTSRT